MLNPGRLRVLLEVASCRSFSEAADALSYTQSAVSQSVARLERETGAVLLVRERGGVRPTAAGAVLLEHAESILGQIEAAEADLEALLGLRAGRLRMASFPSAGAALMPAAIATFRARHPDVSLTLAEDEPEQLAPRLRSGEIDLALLFAFPDGDPALTDGLHTVPLLDDPLHLAVPANHPLAGAPTVSLRDLRGQAWVQTSAASPCARHVVGACRAAGFEPRVAFESDDYETVQGLVAAGVGVALIPRLALGRVRAGIVVRELSPSSPTRTVLAATPAGPGAAPAARTMLHILTEVSMSVPLLDSPGVTVPPEPPGVADLPLPGPLRISSRREGDAIVIALGGELDLASAPELERELREAEAGNPARVVIDLSGLGFMDSTGLQALLRTRERASAGAYELALRRGPHQVQRVFELTKTADAFAFED
jgi:anti-anti-sigma factor